MKEKELMQQQQVAPQSAQHSSSVAQILNRVQVTHPQLTHEEAETVAGNVARIHAQKHLAGHHEPLRKDIIAPVRRPRDGAAAGVTHPTSAQKTPTPIVTSIVETHDEITGNAKGWRLPVGSWEDEIAQIDAIEKTNTGLIAYVQW
jgi:hypothetical protein